MFVQEQPGQTFGSAGIVAEGGAALRVGQHNKGGMVGLGGLIRFGFKIKDLQHGIFTFAFDFPPSDDVIAALVLFVGYRFEFHLVLRQIPPFPVQCAFPARFNNFSVVHP